MRKYKQEYNKRNRQSANVEKRNDTTPRQSYRVLDVNEGGRPRPACRTRRVHEVIRLGVQYVGHDIIVEDRNRAVAVYGGKMSGNMFGMKPTWRLSRVSRVRST